MEAREDFLNVVSDCSIVLLLGARLVEGIEFYYLEPCDGLNESLAFYMYICFTCVLSLSFRSLQPIWEDFASWSNDLGIKVGQVDITSSPGLSGRFMITGSLCSYVSYTNAKRGTRRFLHNY